MKSPLGKIAIVGTGAIGGYYGSLLANCGNDIHFLLRSDYEIVREKGLRVITQPAPIHLMNVNAYCDPKKIGTCDLVIIATKATANENLLKIIPPLLHDKTILFTLQNGLGSDEFLAAYFGGEKVLGGLCFVCATRTAPGEISHYAGGKITLGEFSGEPQTRTETLSEELKRCGIPTTVSKNLMEARWRKLIWNVPFNGLSIAAGNIDVAQLIQPPLRGLVRQIMEEVQATALQFGHSIPDNFLESEFVRTIEMKDYRPSSLVDYNAGRPIEIEAIWGEPLRRAQKAGVATPRLEMLYQILAKLDKLNSQK